MRPEWRATSTPAAAATLTALGYPARIAALLARRGIVDRPGAQRFLHPQPHHLNDPFLLAGMEEAVARLRQAVDGKEKVAIVGDYDVDGVTATALLMAVFRFCGLEAEAVLPHRLRDGYGFQSHHVERAEQAGCGVIVTVDCGTSAVHAVESARRRRIDVIITDHHLPKEDLPDGALLINPQQPGCSYPFPYLCGVGLAFKLAQALTRRLGRPVELEPLLRIACLGTIADVVPLTGENRVIAALGLRALNQTRSYGLRALFQQARLRPPLSAEDIGFQVGPRLNAAGRLDSAERALELLLSREPEQAVALAAELEGWNRKRKETEEQVREEARDMFLRRSPLPGILVAWSPGWHRGVVGIAAGRLARELHRPVVLLAVEEGSATGSGRSVAGVDLHGFLKRWEGRLDRFGGHPYAVGLTVSTQRLDGLREEWEDGVDWSQALLVPRYEYELEVEPREITPELYHELAQLEPYGEGNPQPLLRTAPLSLDGRPRTFGNGHLRAQGRSPDGTRLWLLGWSWQERQEQLRGSFESLGHLEWDRYLKSPVLKLVDTRPHKT